MNELKKYLQKLYNKSRKFGLSDDLFSQMKYLSKDGDCSVHAWIGEYDLKILTDNDFKIEELGEIHYDEHSHHYLKSGKKLYSISWYD